MKTVIIADGSDASLTQQFITKVVSLGHFETEVIDTHDCPDDYYGQDKNYCYVESELSEWRTGLFIVVNIDGDTRRKLEEDFEAFSIQLTDKGCGESLSHDWTIFNDVSFDERVEKLIRVLTKDFTKEIKEIA